MTLALPQSPAPQYAVLPSDALAQSPLDALYLHVPFCSTKCHYCDFYSIAGHLDEAADYLAGLAIEITLHKQWLATSRPRTIFIGGGTPTLLPPAALAQLLTLLHENFDLAHLEEFTVEANPNTFDAEKARILFSQGVNRISFGAQSFHAPELATLQRDHDPASVPRAFAIARHAGFENLSLDLIFGIPGQTLASWESSLAQSLALAPQHISCYSLTYEPNTAMTARLHRGDFQKIDESLELDMFQHVFTRLRAAGFARYEVSNYARLDAHGHPRLCRHNRAYWHAANWLGLGPSAGSHIAFRNHNITSALQWKNAGSLTHYCAALAAPHPRLPITQLEDLAPHTWRAAAAVFWLRLAEGLDYAAFQSRTGTDICAPLAAALQPFADSGFAELTPTRARLTDAGIPVSNHILARVLAALDRPDTQDIAKS